MPILLKATAGLFAGAMIGVLTFAFWPETELTAVKERPAVEQPKFATNAVAPQPAPSATANAASSANAAPATDKAAITKLALALRAGAAEDNAALPSQPVASTPVKATAVSDSERALSMRAQGLVALAGGDIAGARAFLERAAEAGDARALLVLGDTYDPATLTRMGAIGLKGDAARARDYYARALSAGVAAARDRMAERDVRQY